ncbi:Rossmann-fold NAD(P)-binding domain-containing protein [Streptomyces puniciscabiei]|uniref:hypothetical protein n=1 Tax=Streptomyces puniciscabiei TaxID=164348 RepID=UPI0006EBA71E|nr:hypothetical protein [Streptomyces puniciscabiei]
MEATYIAAWTVSGAFVPVLSGNGGTTLTNMLSAASLASWPGFPGMRPPAARRSRTGAMSEALREHS